MVTKASKSAQVTDDQETQFPPEDDEQEQHESDKKPPPAKPVQPTEPAEPLSAGEFDQQGRTWDDSYTAATDNPAHPLRHLKGV